MSNLTTVSVVASKLASLNSLAVVSHVDPDPDAYGSMLGLGITLQEKCSKTVHFVNQTGIIEQYSEFPGIQKVVKTLPDFSDIEAVVVLDCGDLSRVGDSFRGVILPENIEVINIDHHYSNSGFGSLALVSDLASSTSEIVFDVLQEMNLTIPPLAAQALLCGIYGDTGSFQYSSASAKTLRVAADLVDAGGDLTEVSKLLYGSARREAVLLQAYALGNMKFHFDKKVTEVLLTADDFGRFSADPFDAERLVERARDIQGVVVSMFIREHGDLWKVSLRSKHERFDVSKIAESFGGGGHKAAAAFRWKKSVEELRDQLLKKIGEVVGEA